MIQQIKKLKENENYWILINEDTETPYYFNTEKEAKKFSKERKFKNFSIGKESGY